jgi:Trk K+ transport system NAD-binding subunit
MSVKLREIGLATWAMKANELLLRVQTKFKTVSITRISSIHHSNTQDINRSSQEPTITKAIEEITAHKILPMTSMEGRLLNLTLSKLRKVGI